MESEFHLFLPQMRMNFSTILERSLSAEQFGFNGVALMDHLAPPLAESHDMYDAMVTAAYIGAHTESLSISHLVLCDLFRHPTVLAKQSVSLDHATNGRFELGIGWGSVPDELERFGFPVLLPRERVQRLRETLEVLDLLWKGHPFSFEGDFFKLSGAMQQPTPSRDIPLTIGGAGSKTLELVSEFADWWNCPIYAIDRLEKLIPRIGNAQISTQQMISFVPHESQRDSITKKTRQRYGNWAEGTGPIVGDSLELGEYFKKQSDLGVQRFYLWFTDFAQKATLEAFGSDVLDTN